MCTRSAKSDCWKKKSNQSKRGLIPWKRIHGGLRKNYKEYFLVADDKSILDHDNMQKRKLQNLLKISSIDILMIVIILIE